MKQTRKVSLLEFVYIGRDSQTKPVRKSGMQKWAEGKVEPL